MPTAQAGRLASTDGAQHRALPCCRPICVLTTQGGAEWRRQGDRASCQAFDFFWAGRTSKACELCRPTERSQLKTIKEHLRGRAACINQSSHRG